MSRVCKIQLAHTRGIPAIRQVGLSAPLYRSLNCLCM